MLKIGDFSRLAQVPIKTLRFYDELGLFRPAEVDRFTGYRYYTLDQLPRLNRILALKDLGLALEQITTMMNGEMSAEEMRGRLEAKRREAQQEIEEAQARLMRLDIRLRQIDMENQMPTYEIVTKKVDSQRVLSIRQIAPTMTERDRLIEEVRAALRRQPISVSAPPILLYHHAGYRDVDLDIEVAIPVETARPDAILLSNGRQMSIRMIPALDRVITCLLHGRYEQLGGVYAALNTFLNAHRLHYLGPAREVILRGADDTADPAEYLTEVQYPVGDFAKEMAVDGLALPARWDDAGSDQLPLSRRARTALEFAKLEAVAMRQAEISPTHLLLGLLRDGDGFAGRVLSEFGIGIEHSRLLCTRGESQQSDPLVSAAARQVVVFASAEVHALGHDYVGTEHMLLGLAEQRNTAVMHMLGANGLSVDQIRMAVMNRLNRGED
ncbi:MAG: MerR family transcriptional regulator [Anaerolineae bacterium]|nr:MerR family transcriptional regulator [Anaerolineae bacterium]